MNTRPTILTVVIYGAIFANCFGPPLRTKAAQATNPPYLAEFPTVQRVRAELKGSNSMDTAARQMGAFWQFGQVIKKLAGARYYRGATPDENRLIGQYGMAYGAIQQYYASYPDRPKWYQMHAFYETDDAFLDQLLQQFFSTEFRAGYYRTTGKQLPQARRSEPAASPGGRASTGQSAVAAGASPAEVNRELGHKEFEAGQKFDGSRNEAAAAQSFKRALEYYKAAIGLDPNVTGVYARLGHCYFKAKEYQLALSMWKKFRAQQPDNVAVLPDMSRAHRALNQYQQALPLVQEGIQRKPGKIYLLMLYAELGKVYHGLREYEKALAAYQEVIRIDPFFTNHLSIGDANYELQRYPEAAESYTRAIGMFSNNVDAYYGLGLTYMRMGKKDEALGVYKKVLGIDPMRAQELLAEINKGPSPQTSLSGGSRPISPATDTQRPASAAGAGGAKPSTRPRPSPSSSGASSAEAYKIQGDKYRDAKDYAKAIDAYKKALSIDQRYQDAFTGLAVAYSYIEQWQLVVDTLRKLQAFAELHHVYLGILGAAYLNLKNYETALSVFRQIIRLQPSPEEVADAHFWIGEIYREMGQYANAASAFESAVRLKPNDDTLHVHLASAYRQQELYPIAVRTLQQAIRLNPKNAVAFRLLGSVYIDMTQMGNAIAPLQEALRLDGTDWIAKHQLGFAYLMLKRYPDAITAFQETLRLKPDHAESYYWFGVSYVAMGRTNDAIQVHKKLQTIDRAKAQELLAEINKPK